MANMEFHNTLGDVEVGLEQANQRFIKACEEIMVSGASQLYWK